jgi:hypothetical protein
MTEAVGQRPAAKRELAPGRITRANARPPPLATTFVRQACDVAPLAQGYRNWGAASQQLSGVQRPHLTHSGRQQVTQHAFIPGLAGELVSLLARAALRRGRRYRTDDRGTSCSWPEHAPGRCRRKPLKPRFSYVVAALAVVAFVSPSLAEGTSKAGQQRRRNGACHLVARSSTMRRAAKRAARVAAAAREPASRREKASPAGIVPARNAS